MTELTVAADSLVVVRSRLTATAGAPVSVAFADTYRLAEGRLIEHWHVVDAGELGKQLAARGNR